ncbi:MAG: glycosyltransferase family 9 protein [Novosphingobium sp.]
MRDGDHEAAWTISERQAAARPPERRDNPTLPYHLRWVWDGRELSGRDVLVRCYHGLGDTIQFLRFLPELRRRAASVTLSVQPRLMPLLLADEWADRVVPFDPARPTPPGERDVEIMELSFALRALPRDYPPPYLRAAPAPLPPGTIAICCRAGDWDESRSIPPQRLAGLCEGRDCITLDPQPSALPVLNPQGCPFDLPQTAALVSGAAAVVTVDTMIAHLSGALNKPTWLMLKHEPDWRWVPATGRSEWYPSMRVYAQDSPGDWAGVAERVGRDLDRHFPKQRMQDGRSAGLSARAGVVGRTDRQDHHPADQARARG